MLPPAEVSVAASVSPLLRTLCKLRTSPCGSLRPYSAGGPYSQGAARLLSWFIQFFLKCYLFQEALLVLLQNVADPVPSTHALFPP